MPLGTCVQGHTEACGLEGPGPSAAAKRANLSAQSGQSKQPGGTASPSPPVGLVPTALWSGTARGGQAPRREPRQSTPRQGRGAPGQLRWARWPRQRAPPPPHPGPPATPGARGSAAAGARPAARRPRQPRHRRCCPLRRGPPPPQAPPRQRPRVRPPSAGLATGPRAICRVPSRCHQPRLPRRTRKTAQPYKAIRGHRPEVSAA